MIQDNDEVKTITILHHVPVEIEIEQAMGYIGKTFVLTDITGVHPNEQQDKKFYLRYTFREVK